MKRFLLNFVVLMAVVFLPLTGCVQDEDSVSVDKQVIEIVNEAVSFNVTSNVEWTLVQSGDFSFGVSPKKGVPGTTEVKVSYTPNDQDKARNATLTITGGSATAQVQILQNPVEFAVSADTLKFSAQKQTKSIKITSNTEWNIKGITIPQWISSITPEQGKGNGEISITVNENTSRLSENSYLLRISYAGTLSKRIEVKQEAAFNNPPTAPELSYPQDNATEVSTMPLFSWEKSEDAEGDSITYFVYVSEDGKNWKNFSAGNMTSVALPARIGVLKPSTTYYYKVVANDGHNKGITESAIYSFTTSAKDAYADGDYTIYMKSTKASPATLFFTGDGYLAEHFKYGGQFDQDIDTAIEAFFAVEPYKSYREYFTVYKIAAYSNQTGITNLKENDRRDTRFRLEWEGDGSTGINIPDSGESVYALCKTIEGIEDRHFRNGAIGIISNADIYAGTCLMSIDGRSIAMIPYLRNSKNASTSFPNVIRHEMGGHGFGRLADEYQNYDERIPDYFKENLLYWQSRGGQRNVSVYPLQSDSYGSHFAGVKGYSHV
ncbi:MAG: hypothetical protein II202_05315, partial [Bacteroidales bacterium]|nr:hypothetical protein [Bacteroidales bacterium]